MTGSELIAAERQRQLDKEGWTAEHDAKHGMGQLVDAARCYCGAFNEHASQSRNWPWGAKWWKPQDRVRNLVRAGALIAAEIDRVQNIPLCGKNEKGQ